MSLSEVSHEKWFGTPEPKGYPALLMPSGLSQLRLSLTSGTPVTTSDVTGASALLLEAYQGNRIMLPTEWGEWRAFTLPRTPAGLYEVSHSFLASSPYAIANATVYDVFAFLNQSGFVDFELGPAWSSATARVGFAAAGALALRDGVQVKSINPTRILIGTIYASGTNTTEDSAAKRWLWNMYNRVPRFLKVVDTTNTWTQGTADTWRQANASTANQIDLVRGLDEDAITATVYGIIEITTNNPGAGAPRICSVGIGISSTTVNSALTYGGFMSNTGTGTLTLSGRYSGLPGIGRYFLTWLEQVGSAAASTYQWHGDNGSSFEQTGLVVETRA